MKPPTLLQLLLPALLCAAVLTNCSRAQPPAAKASAAPPSGWKVEMKSAAWKTEGFEANLDLSGIAAFDGTHCLLGSDELIAAQPGLIDRKAMTIKAQPPVPLIAEGGKKEEIDIEGVAVSPSENCYYVTGSHGVGKKKGEYDSTRASVFRLPYDPATGALKTAEFKRASLMPWLEKSAEFKDFVKQPLQLNGFNIEGLTHKDGKLWFGVRGPNVKGEAFVIEVSPDSLFGGGGVPECKAHFLPVGEGRGIRELAALRDGFLILTGNASAEATKKFPTSMSRSGDKSFELFLWRPGQKPETQSIGQLPFPAAKAEAILVLEDSEKHVDFLVLFDGAEGGGPRSYRLTRS